MGRVADLLILSLLTLICCLPVVTIGASLTALFYVTLKMVRDEESYIVRSFFKSFKQNFKQATIINLIMLVVAFLLYMDLSIVRSIDSAASLAMQIAFGVILLIYLMIFLYIYPVLSKFYNSVKNTFTNSILMAIRHLPYTILMLVISAIPVLIWFIPNSTVLSFAIFFLLFFGPATIAFCNSFFFVKIFDNYIPAEEEEAD